MSAAPPLNGVTVVSLEQTDAILREFGRNPADIAALRRDAVV